MPRLRSQLVLMIIFAAGLAGAQEKPVAELKTDAQTATGGAPSYKLKASLKSYNDSGRMYEVRSESGRRFKLKNEVVVGITHQSGWGLSVMAVQSGATFGDSSLNRMGASDPSLTLSHPTLFDNGTTKITGQIRQYFPISDTSKNRNQRQTALYSYLTVKLSGGWNLWNQLTPRYFDQSYYRSTDTTFYIEDLTTLTRAANSWFVYGLGQRTQFEWHHQTSVGSVSEVYPVANFIVNKNFSIETKINFPIHKTNSVNDSPIAVAMDNIQANVLAQISI